MPTTIFLTQFWLTTEATPWYSAVTISQAVDKDLFVTRFGGYTFKITANHDQWINASKYSADINPLCHQQI